MSIAKSYVYFAFKGDFEPNIITEMIGIIPTSTWRKGDISKYKKLGAKFSLWELSTQIGKEELNMDILVKEIVTKLNGKEETIIEIKSKFDAKSILQIKMDIDFNDEKSTPILNFDYETIKFLYETKSETDLDIYRFNSKVE